MKQDLQQYILSLKAMGAIDQRAVDRLNGLIEESEWQAVQDAHEPSGKALLEKMGVTLGKGETAVVVDGFLA